MCEIPTRYVYITGHGRYLWYFMQNLLLKTTRKNSATTGRIFIKSDIWVFFKICRYNWSLITIWREWRVLYMGTNVQFWSYLVHFFLEWDVADKSCRESQNTHFMFNNVFFSENRVFYEIIWKNVERGRPQTTIWRMRIACWIPKDTDTFPEYIILIDFPLQPKLQARALMLRYTYVACPVISWPTTNIVDRDSAVGTATRYGLDGPGIESRWGGDFQHPVQTGPRSTQPPVQMVSNLFSKGKAAGAWR